MRRGGFWIVVSLALFAGVPPVRGQGFAPEEAARRMSVADGLEARVFAAEPMVRQPVAIEFDDRGRLWVVQYLQYPNPAGLTRVKVDRFSRTAYDRTPEPPPRGPAGADRITILEDTDGDGRADRSHDFVSGLNLTSGLAFGSGGVYVLNPPYLLFYADTDRDDRPDGPPEVLLSGFGIEDAHSVANSLTWGPDGWLYGLQGSTVTARVRGSEFQQGVWRYHPPSRRFELFAEGGGNMWGLDFDPEGNLFASTNVGGFVMLHVVQGGYYWKSFGKHGPLHNPYTFGYFDHVAHQGVAGGHVSVGGLFYEADAFPTGWRGRYLAGDLLGHAAHWHSVERLGSTFRARQGGDLLVANDTWFAPTDMTLGPDGAVYITDWHDKRTAHPDPDADWDRSNGRIYRIAPPGHRPLKAFDLAGLSNAELVRTLDHPNVWQRRRTRRLLAERHPREIGLGLLRTVLDAPKGPSLETLWTLHGCVGIGTGDLAQLLLEDPEPAVRSWTIRLAGDEPEVARPFAERLATLADREPSVLVRAQLACTARRLPPVQGLEVAWRLLRRDLEADRADPHVPLLLWWAVERHVVAALDATLDRFATPEAWRSDLVRSTILGRLLKRVAYEGAEATDLGCVRLLDSAPNPEARRMLVAALDEGLRGRRPSSVAPPLVQGVVRLAERDPTDLPATRLAARLGSRQAIERVRSLAADSRATPADRSAMIDLLGDLGDRGTVPLLLELATHDPAATQDAALKALGRFEDRSIAEALLTAYPRQRDVWRSEVRGLLLGRPAWASAYLSAIDRGALPAKDLPIDLVGRIALLGDPALDALVRKHWGTVKGPTPEEKLAEIRRLNNDLRAAPGDPARGRTLFGEKCAACHRLFDEGKAVGPDLSFANRGDRDFLLVSLVDPSGVVRKEYQTYIVQTQDGRILTGLITEQSPDAITLRDAKGEPTRIPRLEVEALKESPASVMPESLYKEFTPSQLRDLFAYLQGPPPSSRKAPR